MKKNYFFYALISYFLFFSAINVFAAETKIFDTKNLTDLSVKNIGGDVTITSSHTDKAMVTFTKIKFDEQCELSIDKIEQKLLVAVTNKPGLFSFSAECIVNFDIAVPEKIDTSLKIGAGDINITKIEGDLSYKLGSGDLKADGLFKKVTGTSGSGDVEMKGLTGSAHLNVGSGDLRVTYKKIPEEGFFDVKAGSGNVSLYLPKGSEIQADLKAGSGKVSNEFAESSKAKFNVSMRAGSGNVAINSHTD